MPNPAAQGPHDPLLELLNAYWAGVDAFNTDPREDNDDELREETFGPYYDALGENPPAPTTLEGCIAALESVVREDASVNPWTDPVLLLVANFLRQLAGGAHG